MPNIPANRLSSQFDFGVRLYLQAGAIWPARPAHRGARCCTEIDAALIGAVDLATSQSIVLPAIGTVDAAIARCQAVGDAAMAIGFSG
jgi:hypothetical protein